MEINRRFYSSILCVSIISAGCYLIKSAQKEEEIFNVIRRKDVVVEDSIENSIRTRKCLVDFIYNSDTNKVQNIGADTIKIINCAK